MKILGGHLDLQIRVATDGSLCRECGRRNSERRVIDRKDSLHAVIVGVNCAVNGDLPARTVRGTSRGCLDGKVSARPRLVDTSLPASVGRAIERARQCSAFEFWSMQCLLRGSQ